MTSNHSIGLDRNKLSQSVTDASTPLRKSKIDRLTASKSMFAKDKFAESLAKVRINVIQFTHGTVYSFTNVYFSLGRLPIDQGRLRAAKNVSFLTLVDQIR